MRQLLACVTVSLLGCDVPVESSPPTGTVATPSASTSASAAQAPPPAAPPVPASITAYFAEVRAKCPDDEGDGSTQGMVAGKRNAAKCQARLNEIDTRKLSPAQRGALLDGWQATVDAACLVEIAQTWTGGGMRFSGTMEPIVAGGCLLSEHRGLGLIAHSWVDDRPADVVALVRLVAGDRPAPRLRLAVWRRYAALARRTSPHSAVPECGYLCRLTDAEWLALEAEMDHAERGARARAVAVCAEWEALAVAFGGQAICEDEMASYWLPSSTGIGDGPGDEGDPKTDALPDPPHPDLPPPADEIYDAATLAMRRDWAKEDAKADGETKGAARYLADIEREILAGPRKDLARWVRRAATWRDRFAVADNQASFMRFSNAAADWSREPYENINPTARLLEGYLLRGVVAHDERVLREHVLARQTWGNTVASNLEMTRDVFEKPCVPNIDRDCKGVTPTGFRKVSERLTWLLTEGRALGSALCDAAPELRNALGSECPSLASMYLFSFATYAGDPKLLEGW